MITNPKKRKIVLVVGKTGYGKSFLVKSVIGQLDRCVILDLLGEYSDAFPNWQLVTDLQSVADCLKASPEADDTLKIVVQLGDLESYERVIEMVYRVGNLTLVCEEISNFCSATYMTPAIENIIRFGRHRSVSVVGISQRLFDMSLLLRNNADMLICFNLTAPNDLSYLESLPYVGEQAQEVGRLSKYQSKIFINQ